MLWLVELHFSLGDDLLGGLPDDALVEAGLVSHHLEEFAHLSYFHILVVGLHVWSGLRVMAGLGL